MSASLTHPTDSLVDDPWYSRLKEYLIGATGMSYYANKDADLALRLRRRLAHHGFGDCAAYMEHLRDPLGGPAEMEALIAEITIGESYFFRHREHYQALRDVVLPDLIARNRDLGKLRIWCAGCSDGAEPYTLSMILRQEPGHLPAGWQTSILGTDINRKSLAAARAGLFEEWSLRATPADVRQACFSNTGKRWLISPAYRDGVSFAYHNLAESDFPPPGNIGAFELIICRNVMIYFSPELMRKVVERFHACLAPGGWLLVGPSEPNMNHFTSFLAVNAPGVTLYQKPASAETKDVPAASQKRAFECPALEPILPLLQPGATEPAAGRPAETIPDLPCGNLDPLTHFHLALDLKQSGDIAEAERSLRRAIYLDRKAPLPHYHLGLLLEERGDVSQAGRCFGNVLKVLRSLPRNTIPGGGLTPGASGEGLTVEALARLAETRLEAIRVGEVSES